MIDIIKGIIAIIIAILILSMRQSEKKWIAFVGWIIFIAIMILQER